MKNFNHLNSLLRGLAGVLAMIGLIGLPTTASADGWELRTTYREVPGTREIEKGEIERGVKLSEIYLTRTTGDKKVAVLTNLCVGYIKSRDIESAEPHCREAAELPFERAITHNNLGVLYVLKGDYAEAHRMFSIAAHFGCIQPCDEDADRIGDRPYQVALRNLDRTAPGVLASDSGPER